MSWTLDLFSHLPLSLRVGWSTIQQTRLRRNCPAYYGIVRSLAVLQLLLRFCSSRCLPLRRNRPGSNIYNNLTLAALW